VNVINVIHTYGYLDVLGFVGVESLGTLLLGETARIIAAAYAGRPTGSDPELILAVTSASAIIGDNIGHWIAGKGGHHLARHPFPA
jgi:membrane protein DedA with SNARE-associated domain